MIRRIVGRYLAAVFLVFAVDTAQAGTALPKDLKSAADAFDAAQIDGDGAALNRLLADDYDLLNGDGSEEDRSQFIRDYTQPGFRLDPIVVTHPIIRVWAGGAVMSGVARLAGVSDGARFERCIRFTDIWSLRRDRWKVAFTHVSRPPANACGDSSK